MNNPERNRVLIWRWTFLAASETFIRNQIKAYEGWHAFGVGAVRANTVNSNKEDIIIYPETIFGKVSKTVFRVIDFSPSLKRVIKNSDPQIIHAHFAIDGMRMRPLAKRSRIPLVVTLHGSDITSSPLKPGIRGHRYRLRLKRLFRDASLLVAVSNHIAEKAIGLGAPANKVKVVPIGVPWKPITNDQHRRRNIVFVGRLVEKKGVSQLFEALSLIDPKMLEGHRIIVVGDGPLRDPLKAQARDLKLPIDFLGFVDPQVVHENIEAAVAVAVPSITARNGDTEGLPTVVFESLRAGTPIVGFSHAGIPEAVEDGHSGLLYSEGDVEGLSDGILRLLSNETEARIMGNNARVSFETRFDIDKQTKLVESLYDDLRR